MYKIKNWMRQRFSPEHVIRVLILFAITTSIVDQMSYASL